jgi:hypothetical protein
MILVPKDPCSRWNVKLKLLKQERGQIKVEGLTQKGGKGDAKKEEIKR